MELRPSSPVAALYPVERAVELGNGHRVRYAGLIVATGARARRLASPKQLGELVVRALENAQDVAARVQGAGTAVVVGAGFLGMELASTLSRLGLAVTVVDRDLPLLRLLGPWLAELMSSRAVGHGVRIVVAPGGVTLVGNPVRAVACAPRSSRSMATS